MTLVLILVVFLNSVELYLYTGYVNNGGLAHLATQNSGVGIRPANSCSSKELSDENEEELERDTDMNDDMDPANAKRMKR